mmetsp:Transcript_62639/g.173621  ORF Transcript_62639/g.173621 Transcript_62639/m.173621 type:complete len:206 (-) Transcript_62639:1125-1742(-)
MQRLRALGKRHGQPSPGCLNSCGVGMTLPKCTEGGDLSLLLPPLFPLLRGPLLDSGECCVLGAFCGVANARSMACNSPASSALLGALQLPVAGELSQGEPSQPLPPPLSSSCGLLFPRGAGGSVVALAFFPVCPAASAAASASGNGGGSSLSVLTASTPPAPSGSGAAVTAAEGGGGRAPSPRASTPAPPRSAAQLCSTAAEAEG